MEHVLLHMQLWPVLATWFDVAVGPPLRIPLTQFMPHHKDTWASIIKKHGLKDIPFEKVPITPTMLDSCPVLEMLCIHAWSACPMHATYAIRSTRNGL